MLEEVQRQRKHKVDGRDVETKRAMPREVGGNAPHFTCGY